MKTKKHILFLTPGFPENEEDTTCIPALQIFMHELQKSNQVEISIITFQYPFNSGIYLWNSIKVYAIGGKNSKQLNRLITWQKVLKTTKRIQNEKPIDQIHSIWLNECAYMGAIISKKMKLPHSCTLMGQDVLRANKYFNRIKNMPRLIALSKFQSDTLFDHFQVRPDMIIPWGINEIKKATSSERRIDIIGIGSLTPLKGFSRFIKTISEIQKNIPDIKSEIIGDGPEMESLRRQITTLNLENNISLIGKLERKNVIDKLFQSKVLLHFSEYESFGMIYLEALQTYVKVFSVKVGIASEIEGIVFIENEIDAAKKIIDFLKSYEVATAKMPYSIKDTIEVYCEKIFKQYEAD